MSDWPLLSRYYGYDWEVYPNVACVTIVHIETRKRWIFEFSERANDGAALYTFLMSMKHFGFWLVGYNNASYDYFITHHFIEMFKAKGIVTAADLYERNDYYFKNQNNDRFGLMIWDNQRHVHQLDLLKVHHFDNINKRTSLKALEFNMRSWNIADLPFEAGTWLTLDQIPVLIEYNAHDVNETINFFFHSAKMIQFRENLSEKLNKNFMNHNDTKIGKDYFIDEIEKVMPGTCFYRDQNNKRQPRQSRRKTIPLAECLFPYVQFITLEFQEAHRFLYNTVLTSTNKPPELENLKVKLRGFTFKFGAGGMHGSVTKRVARTHGDYIVVDADVASFYPNLAIANNVYPEHLSPQFCGIYLDLYNQRSQYDKKSSESGMLKLALNGVYGDSNNDFSPFHDPKYTMTITVNGQLLLCMLAEQCMQFEGIEILQINTDGFTVIMHKSLRPVYDQLCAQWEALTKLKLEFATYDAMYIRDVNNYFAVSDGGKKLKRIGAYAYETAAENPATRELGWNKNWSCIAVQKAAVQSMITGRTIEDLIYGNTDPFEFMLRAKANKGARLVAQYSNGEVPLQRTTRYFVAKSGPEIIKIMKDEKKGGEKRIREQAGWQSHICDDIRQWDGANLNYDFYIQEAKKLVIHG